MILILTNKDDVTVDFVVRELQRQHLKYYRLNTEDIPETVKINFDVSHDTYLLNDGNKGLTIDLQDVSSVYFRRPGISKLDSLTNTTLLEKRYLQNELISTLEGIYKILESCYWLNNVYKIREAENKIFQLRLAREIGFELPETIITNTLPAVVQMTAKNNGDCIIKPIRSGNLNDTVQSRVIFTSMINADFAKDRERIEVFPVYLQKNIHKICDLRCVVVGDDIYCAKIDSQINDESKIDWRKGVSSLRHEKHQLPLDIERKCLEMTRKLGLHYSAIDLVIDEHGKYVFLECNPNGQWAWLEIRLGFPISRDIVRMLDKR